MSDIIDNVPLFDCLSIYYLDTEWYIVETGWPPNINLKDI